MKLLGVLRAVALTAVVVGAIGSIAFMLRIGARNPSRLLILAFLLWDAAPFVGLVCADIASTHWSGRARASLYAVMSIVSLASLAVYGNVAFGAPRSQPAFSFLVVPAVSWLPIAIVVAIGYRNRLSSADAFRNHGRSRLRR